MKKYKNKIKNKNRECKYCKVNFLAADVKSSCCYECNTKIEIQCQCGCGKTIKKAKWKCDINPYWINHQKKGKTYQEIYGTETPNCGFGKGVDNPMANPILREAARQGVINSYTPELLEKRRLAKIRHHDEGLNYGKFIHYNNRNEKFRSILEYNFAEFLYNNSIKYEFEPESIKFPENEYNYFRKVIDFKIGNTLIEITGLAYKKWIDEFILKINLLKKAVPNEIIILTYPNKISEINCLIDNRTHVLNIYEPEKILKLL